MRANDMKVCNTQQGRAMENQRKRDAVIKPMTKEHNGLPNFIYVILSACVSTTQKEFKGHTLLDET
jgi:hypothetical protein